MTERYPFVGHRLRVTRLVLGITEQQAADAAKITIRTSQKWERGGYSGCLKLLDFAREYDVRLDWIIDGDMPVRAHLAKNAKGKTAILPVEGPSIRERRKLHGPLVGDLA